MNDLAVRPQTNDVSIFNQEPQVMVKRATRVANTLKNVIDQQHLYSNIQGNKYVKCEGWQTLGNMLGILPKENEVKELDDGSFVATVDLINMSTGHTVGSGSAMVGMDEKRWSKAEKYARRSMAVTRATGKAYRISFGWIMNLAGYQATPAEEMPFAPIQTVLYKETPEQKVMLANLAKEAGITDKDALKEISSFAKGKPLDGLESLVANYIENPLG